MRECLAGRLQWCCLDRAGGNARRGAARSDLDSGPGDSARECRAGSVVRRWGGRVVVDTLPNSSKKCFAVLSSVAPRDAPSLCLLCQRRGYSPVALVRSGGLVAMLVQGPKTRFRGSSLHGCGRFGSKSECFVCFLGNPRSAHLIRTMMEVGPVLVPFHCTTWNPALRRRRLPPPPPTSGFRFAAEAIPLEDQRRFPPAFDAYLRTQAISHRISHEGG